MGIRRWGWPVLAAIFVASVAYYIVTLHMGDVRLARQLPGQLQFFVVGMALYLVRSSGSASTRWSAPRSRSDFFCSWTTVQPIPPGIRPLIVGAFVFSFALCTPVVRMRSDLSYSVYLRACPVAADADPARRCSMTRRCILAGVVLHGAGHRLY